MFDSYTLKARVYPMIILFSPIVILGIFYSIQFETIFLLLSSIGIVGSLMYLLSQLGRDQGKLNESFLWQAWGGAPSTQVLRLNNIRIDRYTKERYHKKLLALCPVSVIPDVQMENTNSDAADEIYKTWTKFLIAKTRNSKTYGLLLKDNTSYGFRRNLWGLKRFAIWLIVVLIIINYGFWAIRLGTFSPLSFPGNFKYSEIVLILILAFWIFKVTTNWIKIPAFAYAERLFESLENM